MAMAVGIINALHQCALKVLMGAMDLPPAYTYGTYV
jgi:hypothetical protein